MADENEPGRVLVIVWPHEQPAVEALPPAEPPRVPGTATNERRQNWADPVWEALSGLRDERGIAWDRGFASVVTELELRSLVVEDRETRFHPRPNLEGRWGEIFTREGSAIDQFRPELTLNNDGPTVPSLGMLARLLQERRPQLVISVGLGGGVRPDDQIGDVVLATHAEFALPGDLETSELNGQEPFGGTFTLEPAWFTDITLGELQELPLQPASPSFREPEGGWPQPPPHRPSVRVENERPVLTRPAISAPAFIPAPTIQRPNREPDPREFDTFVGDRAAVDMDAAVAAKACAEADVPFVAVIGLSVPALVRPPVDWSSSIRDAWAETFNRQFGAAAAGNAALVTERLVERVTAQ